MHGARPVDLLGTRPSGAHATVRALGPRRDVIDYPPDIFEQVLRVNVIGALNFTQAALPHLLRAAPGVLINLSSGLGRFGVRQVSAYCASKFAIEGFTQSLADEHDITIAVAADIGSGILVKADSTRLKQVFLNIVEFGMDPQAAVEAPRAVSHSFPNSFWPHGSQPGVAVVESRVDEEVRRNLAGRGHKVQ